MIGKSKCRILKEIRQRIADENEIPYVTQECHFKGECSGTCPRCESELRYLEQQLSLRASMGKRVAVAALCAGMALSAAGCGPQKRETIKPDGEIAGGISYVENQPEDNELQGKAVPPEETCQTECGEPETLPGDDEQELVEIELMGEVAYIPDVNYHG